MLYLVGVGGAGSRLVDSFYQKNVVKRIIKKIHSRGGWDFEGIAIDTSDNVKGLSSVPGKNIALIGKSRVKGHGTGVDVSLGEKIVTEELALAMNKLGKIVKGKPWLILLFAGLGGGTGTGGIPVISKRIKEAYKCRVLGVFVFPSSGEGRVYVKNAFSHLDEVLSSVDGSILLDNNVVTDRGEDILSAHKQINQQVLDFFKMVDESFFERCLNKQSTIAYLRPGSDRVSVKDAIERMLRETLYLKFDVEKSGGMVFVARGNLEYLYGHDFALGWAREKFGFDVEYLFYDEPGSKSLELGLLITETKDLNGRLEDISEVERKKKTSDLEDLLKDIHSIF